MTQSKGYNPLGGTAVRLFMKRGLREEAATPHEHTVHKPMRFRSRGYDCAVYVRGANPPYTEGYIAAARSLARAFALSGLSTVLLNFKYSTRTSVDRRFADSEVRSLSHFDVRIPHIERGSLLHSRRIGPYPVLAAILESIHIPFLIAQEVRANASIVHLVNCFKFPRALLRVISRKPVVSHVYHLPAPSKLPELPLPVDASVASSLRIAKSLRTHFKRSSIHIVPPAVNTHFFQTNPDFNSRRKLGLYIGNLSCSRMPDDLLKIFREIIRVDPDISFRLIAPVNPINIPRAYEIRTICKSLQIEDKVSVSLRDMDDNEKLREYRTAKCFVFAPIRECQEVIEPPLTALEALSSGLPVLATDAYSVSEAVVSGKNGFLVNMRDYANLADRAINILQADQSVWRAWSMNARSTAIKNFSISVMSSRLARIHSTILENQTKMDSKIQPICQQLRE